MKHAFVPRFCFHLLVASGLLWSSVQAIEVPGDNINYNTSQIMIRYDSPSLGGANSSLPCFGSDDISALIIRSLSDVGISDVDEIVSILSGDSMACFQKAGDYQVQFLLEDSAGNQILLPSGINPLNPPGGFDPTDPANTYQITVVPGNPSLDDGVHPGLDTNGDGDYNDTGDIAPGSPIETTTIEQIGNDINGDGDTDDAGEGVGSSGCEVPADGVANCVVEVVFRDQFGNVITQYSNPSDIQVFFSGSNDPAISGGVSVDGILSNVSSGTEITASNAFENTNSASTFLSQVLAGTPGNYQDLAALLSGGAQIDIRAKNGGADPGYFEFVVRSYAPTMKLLDAADPAFGAGVYRQRMNFDLDLPRMDANGNIISPRESVTLSDWVDERFAFVPIAEATPSISPSDVTWGTVLGNITTTLTGVVTDYILFTPFDEYVLNEKVENGGTGELEVQAYPQPFANTNTVLTGATTDEGPVFNPASGSVGGSLSANVGVGSQVQYLNGNGVTVRHISYTSGATSGACPSSVDANDYVECYPYDPTGSARFIGADIEGAVQANSEDILIYEIDNGTNDIGRDTTYAGDMNNDAIRDDLLQQVQRAITAPNSDAVVASNNTNPTQFNSFSSKFTNHDVVIVNGSVRMTSNNVLPTSGGGEQKTLIIVDGNLFVEADQAYQNTRDSFGVVIYNTNQTRIDGSAPTTGNIFVQSNVHELAGSYYADGSFVSVPSGAPFSRLWDGTDTINDLTYQDQIDQFVLTGVLWSNNTLGGSLIRRDFDGDGTSEAFVSPWHRNGTTSEATAKVFDIHFFRRYDGTGAGCTSGNGTGGCDVNTNATVIRLDGKVGYEQTSPPVFRSIEALVR